MEVKKDMYGRGIEEIYSDLEKDYKIPKELGNTQDEAYENQSEIFFWQDDVNDILGSIGLDQTFDLEDFPKDRLVRLLRYYNKDSQKIDENGKVTYIDPAPGFRAESNDSEFELGKLGYSLGLKGTLGMYYILLPIDSFRHSYYLGKYEKGMELDDDKIILEVSKEMKIYDAATAEEELTNIHNHFFPQKEEIEEIEKTR